MAGMDTLDKIRRKIAIYIVDYSIEWSDILFNGIECSEPFYIKKFANGEEFINFLKNEKLSKRITHVALIGYTFYDEKNQTLMNGIEILESLKKIKPFVNAIMLANEDEQEYGGYVKKLGAVAVINKDDSALLRINNHIALLFSKQALAQRKKDFKIALYIWIGTIIIMASYLLIGYYLI